MLYECDTAADCPVIRCNAHAPHEKNGLCDQRNNCGAVQSLVRCQPVNAMSLRDARSLYNEMSGDNVAEPVVEQSIRAFIIDEALVHYGLPVDDDVLWPVADLADRATSKIMKYLHSIDLV